MNNNSDNHFLRLIIALPCEAKPLIKHYGLKRCVDESAYSMFRNQQMTLTISGVGKLAAAGAVAYTQGRYGSTRNTVWLNIGIAGHRTIDIGKCLLAHKIIDSETSRCWYPGLVLTPPCETSDILTVSQPETDYTQNCLYEMEAAGFMATAIRFSSLECIHVVKVVSDNQSTPATTLNEKLINQLIESQLSTIDAFINEFEQIRQHIQARQTVDNAAFLAKWHFTAQQSMQLTTLLSQWQIRSADSFPTVDNIAHLKTSRQVIHWLKTQVSSLPVKF